MGEQRGTIKVTAKIYHLTKAFFLKLIRNITLFLLMSELWILTQKRPFSFFDWQRSFPSPSFFPSPFGNCVLTSSRIWFLVWSLNFHKILLQVLIIMYTLKVILNRHSSLRITLWLNITISNGWIVFKNTNWLPRGISLRYLIKHGWVCLWSPAADYMIFVNITNLLFSVGYIT